MTLRIVFRADASLQIGSGHVMRCLTLADALRAKGAQCHFIIRAHPGHLMEVIRQRGYVVSTLAAPTQKAKAAIKNGATTEQDRCPNHLHKRTQDSWLGCTWQTDAQETAAVLSTLHPDWLVVDHYALDQGWEDALATHYCKLLVIDDLADRPHRCDLLLDQNLGRQSRDYSTLVPKTCQVLIGPHYALLRPEFAELRGDSLKRRANQQGKEIKQLLVTMGGVDQPNATKQVLQALKDCPLPQACRIIVVMGLKAPWLQDVQEMVNQMSCPIEIVVNVSDMAQRMADSDLAIGAAGSTSWERCCLGLPTLMVVLAANQNPSAQAMEAADAARLIGSVSDIGVQLPIAFAELIESERHSRMSLAASAITDGRGVEKVIEAMGVTND